MNVCIKYIKKQEASILLSSFRMKKSLCNTLVTPIWRYLFFDYTVVSRILQQMSKNSEKIMFYVLLVIMNSFLLTVRFALMLKTFKYNMICTKLVSIQTRMISIQMISQWIEKVINITINEIVNCDFLALHCM